MKSLFISSVFLVLSLFSTANLQAQQHSNNKNNYVVLTKKVPQLQPIILAAKALKAEDGDNFGDFQVIICGKGIKAITHPEEINGLITKAEELGVQIVTCGFSVNKFNVDKTKIPKEIKTVENGILYNFQLQKKDYKSISL